MSNAHAIYSVIRSIPSGCVATYGQVAKLAGLPGAARLVGYTLRNLPESTHLPWHRVVNAQGKIALPSDSAAYITQIARLAAEGVQLTNGRLSLAKHQWRPTASSIHLTKASL